VGLQRVCEGFVGWGFFGRCVKLLGGGGGAKVPLPLPAFAWLEDAFVLNVLCMTPCT